VPSTSASSPSSSISSLLLEHLAPWGEFLAFFSRGGDLSYYPAPLPVFQQVLDIVDIVLHLIGSLSGQDIGITEIPPLLGNDSALQELGTVRLLEINLFQFGYHAALAFSDRRHMVIGLFGKLR